MVNASLGLWRAASSRHAGLGMGTCVVCFGAIPTASSGRPAGVACCVDEASCLENRRDEEARILAWLGTSAGVSAVSDEDRDRLRVLRALAQ